ncbi:MAG: alpha/beta hydrolase [Verrucomicrobia bacterium]|nr:alpha/beta hydrolase [Verrucomicrobiota bacterium]
MKHTSRTLLAAALLFAASSGAFAQAGADFKRAPDVIYGRKLGVVLTMDVFQPAKPNGHGILFMVSGGWFSAHQSINPVMYQPFLARGYTVFAVVHGSQPKFVIPEITQDIHRAVRFVRANAKQWGVDPDKLGITGGSAGGHLSLTMGTQGRAGDPNSKDAVERVSSEVQAVACFYPPTDFLNYGQTGEDAVGVGTLKNFKNAFGSRADTEEGRRTFGKEISPIYFITAKMPPTLIIHGDADKLVPIQQAESFVDKAAKAGATAKLITKPGKAHGWPDQINDITSLADWFDEHLRGIKPKK